MVTKRDRSGDVGAAIYARLAALKPGERITSQEIAVEFNIEQLYVLHIMSRIKNGKLPLPRQRKGLRFPALPIQYEPTWQGRKGRGYYLLQEGTDPMTRARALVAELLPRLQELQLVLNSMDS